MYGRRWSGQMRLTLTLTSLFGHKGKCYLWQQPNTSHHPKSTVPTVKHGGGSIMLWGYFAAAGPGKLVRIEGKMDGAKCRDILGQNLFKSACDLRLGWRFTFQQDNNPKHTAEATLEWLKEKKLYVLEWPGQSLDRNPVENHWFDLQTAVHKQKPSNLEELEKFCCKEWAKIPVARCGKLKETYQKRLAAVIATKGDPTKYWLYRGVNNYAHWSFLASLLFASQ